MKPLALSPASGLLLSVLKEANKALLSTVNAMGMLLLSQVCDERV